MKIAEKNWKNIIEYHKEYFKQNNEAEFKRAYNYYRGNFYSDNDVVYKNDIYKQSFNLVFSIVDTAVSSLLSPNPQVTAKARNLTSEEEGRMAENIINFFFSEINIRDEIKRSIVDAVLIGRGIFKTTWNIDEDCVDITSVNPKSVFFDLTARRQKDIRYFIEATVISYSQFLKRVESKAYNLHNETVTPIHYPEWLSCISPDELKKVEADWIQIYEVWDIENKKVYHINEQLTHPLFVDELPYNPYTILEMNNNGQNCEGLSEISLIMPQQEEINEILSYWMKIVHLQVPRFLYDAGAIGDQEDINAALFSTPGAFVPVKTGNARELAASIFPLPQPQINGDTLNLLGKLEQIVQFVSALADSSRGQVSGARTATELALIDGNNRTRLGTRSQNIDYAISDIATKSLFLASNFMKEEKIIEISGYEKPVSISAKSLYDIKVRFEAIPYSPVKSNRAVLQESFMALYPILKQSENYNSRVVDEELLKVNELSPQMLIPEEELNKAVQQMTGGIPGMPPMAGAPVPSPTNIPAQDMEINPQKSVEQMNPNVEEIL